MSTNTQCYLPLVEQQQKQFKSNCVPTPPGLSCIEHAVGQGLAVSKLAANSKQIRFCKVTGHLMLLLTFTHILDYLVLQYIGADGKLCKIKIGFLHQHQHGAKSSVAWFL